MLSPSLTTSVSPVGRRLLVTFGALLVYWLGRHVPVAGIDGDVANGSSRSHFSADRLSIFALGVMPIFSALIVFEIARLVFPRLARWEAAGARQLTAARRWVLAGALFLAAFQGLGLAEASEGIAGLVVEPGWTFRTLAIATFVAATTLLGWLGELITVHGVGNGFWLLLLAGPLADLSRQLGSIEKLWRAGEVASADLAVALLFVIVALALVGFAYQGQRSILRRGVWGGAACREDRLGVAAIAIVWPPALAVFVGNGLFMGAQLLAFHSGANDDAFAFPLGGLANLIFLAAFILVVTLLQRRSHAGSSPASARFIGSLRPEMVILVAQLFVVLGAALLSRHAPLLALNGAWLFIAGATAMDFIDSLGFRPGAEAA
ncbi:MAG TPA: hypothetical protein VEH76_08330 [Methylocystis sp.]|nr:hypothetical protein [Methylocystis sp.]